VIQPGITQRNPSRVPFKKVYRRFGKRLLPASNVWSWHSYGFMTISFKSERYIQTVLPFSQCSADLQNSPQTSRSIFSAPSQWAEFYSTLTDMLPRFKPRAPSNLHQAYCSLKFVSFRGIINPQTILSLFKLGCLQHNFARLSKEFAGFRSWKREHWINWLERWASQPYSQF
jgi:hypothetical protein